MPTTTTTPDLDLSCVNTIRTLSMDAVQAANSGHPGTPMAMAPVAYCLWQKFLRFDPGDPIWPNRDRFVLSMGHASMLLYSLLHLTGVKSVSKNYETLGEPSVPLEAIQKFRQLDSKCAGHPEYRWTSGVETTTGPLGQGIATSVGMAMGGKWMAAHFNKPDFPLFDFDVYALCGDGCMMEGASGEAASLAGHLKLSNLCWIYDNNKITIEGSTDVAFSEDVATRFIGYGWNVTRVGDANDLDGDLVVVVDPAEVRELEVPGQGRRLAEGRIRCNTTLCSSPVLANSVAMQPSPKRAPGGSSATVDSPASSFGNSTRSVLTSRTSIALMPR